MMCIYPDCTKMESVGAHMQPLKILLLSLRALHVHDVFVNAA